MNICLLWVAGIINNFYTFKKHLAYNFKKLLAEQYYTVQNYITLK